MSVQEPRDQFERESVEDEIDELQDTMDETPINSDSSTSNESESIDVPADDSALADETDEVDETNVPAVESMPLSS